MSTVPHQLFEPLDYKFVLLAHIIAADRNKLPEEADILRELASQAHVSPATRLEMEKILTWQRRVLSLKDAALQVPEEQRNKIWFQICTYQDTPFSQAQRDVLQKLAGFWPVTKKVFDENSKEGVAYVNPDEYLQQETLLSGPNYDEAIRRCTKIAQEDYEFTKKYLTITEKALQRLYLSIQETILNLGLKIRGAYQEEFTKNFIEKLDKTSQSLSTELLDKLENVQTSLQVKQRSLSYFTLAFLGKTKAGKSTLHAVLTKGGWDAIGCGKQRTTQDNRIYIWNNIRIIDTPGIGAPGGKSDEEIAKSILGETDVICYIVTNDNTQKTDFEFLKLLKEKTKPLIILINLQDNLRHPYKLQRFLKSPDNVFPKDGRNRVEGHIEMIRSHAKNYYPDGSLEILPVMLLAAQLAQEPEHAMVAEELFKSSQIQNLLDRIYTSITDYGLMHRSQTLLGSTVGDITSASKWIHKQIDDYTEFSETLEAERKKLKKKLEKVEKEIELDLRQSILEVFQDAFNLVPEFAEQYCESSHLDQKNGWNQKLNSIRFHERLKENSSKVIHNFQNELQEALEDIGKELNLLAKLKKQDNSEYVFQEHDTDDTLKNLLRFGGGIFAAAFLLLSPLFPPLFPFSIVSTLLSWLSNLFESRQEKRSKAISKISSSLQNQLTDGKTKILESEAEYLKKYCHSINTIVDQYFQGIIHSFKNIEVEFRQTLEELNQAENALNEAYAKRILDWATDNYENLTESTIRKKIQFVNRNFGKEIHIGTHCNLPLKKSKAEIEKIIQERIEIESLSR